jgi:hypothetical protein
MVDEGVTASHAEAEVKEQGQRLRRTRGYRGLVRTGLVCYGVVHLLIAWIALQVAWGGRGDASQRGALQTLSKTGPGPVLLVVVAVGMLTLALWQVVEAAFGNGRVAEQHDETHRTRKRLSSAGRALVYLLLGISAFRLVLGGGGGSKGQEDGLTSRLMSVPLGRVLVIAVGVAVLAVGISQVVRGVRQTFTEDLSGDRTRATRLLGTVGYIAKGVAFGVVASLFGWAALTYDPKKAGGLDAALHTVASQPQGSLLLTVLAVGFAAFGVFCFVWARNARI